MRGSHIVNVFAAILASILVIWIVAVRNEPAELIEVKELDGSQDGEQNALGASSSGSGSGSSSSSEETPAGYTLFSVQIPPQGNYVDRVDLASVVDMDMMGMRSQMTTSMQVVSARTVQDLAGGGASVDTIVESASYEVGMTGGMGESRVSCDSGHADDTQDALQTTICQPFYDLVGTNSHFVLDEEGTIVEASGPGAELVQSMTTATTSSTNNEGEQHQDATTDKVSPSSALLQSSRMLQLLPEHPVKDNDEWDSSVDMGDIGAFTGTSKFVGFEDYNGIICAVVESSGTLEIDFTAASSYLGDGVGALMEEADIHTKNSTLQATVYWDEDHKISRLSRTKMSMIMTMKDPIGGSTISMPIQETVTLATDPEE